MFLYPLNEMGLPASPIVCWRPHMLSSWKGHFFTVSKFLAHVFPAVTNWGQIAQHCVPPILFIIDAHSLQLQK